MGIFMVVKCGDAKCLTCIQVYTTAIWRPTFLLPRSLRLAIASPCRFSNNFGTNQLTWSSMIWIMLLNSKSNYGVPYWIMESSSYFYRLPLALRATKKMKTKLYCAKISPHDFQFLPLFSSCTCWITKASYLTPTGSNNDNGQPVGHTLHVWLLCLACDFHYYTKELNNPVVDDQYWKFIICR